ncbi:MAG: dethiobiotin synthase [Moraxella sp.]|nr:dethiobiotin synthase [Moraxella sp.]
MTAYFITGIDTDVGKTYATAFLYNQFSQTHTTITQKIVQTGNTGISQDIITHRQLTNTPFTKFDTDGITCPYTFSKAASPHLSARLENTIIKPNKISQATQRLEQHYQIVLLEGAGGIFTPLTDTLTTLDYITAQDYPVIVVTCAKLGSINHTLLTLSAISQQGLIIDSVVFNHYFDNDIQISQSTQEFLQSYLAIHYPKVKWIDMPKFIPNNHSFS